MESKLEAHIAVDKNRLKEYGDGKVYLRDGTNFQVELFNGERDTFGAVLELNGKAISDSKLVLRPGERIFLDRYIDDQVKFLFETYEVDGSDAEVREAIKNNGNVTVKFYRERDVVKFPHTKNRPHLNISNSGGWTFDGFITVSGSIGATSGTTGDWNGGSTMYSSTANASPTTITVNDFHEGFLTSGFASFDTNTSDYSVAGATLDWATPDSTAVRSTKTVETGRIGKGSRSDQEIDRVDVFFEHLPEFEAQLHILPESQRSSYVSSEIRKYCTGCGTRIRGRWRFCANCGEQV